MYVNVYIYVRSILCLEVQHDQVLASSLFWAAHTLQTVQTSSEASCTSGCALVLFKCTMPPAH